MDTYRSVCNNSNVAAVGGVLTRPFETAVPNINRISILSAAACALLSLPVMAQTWMNGTGLALECDFCILQSPTMVTVAAGQDTPLLYGRLFEAGVTEAAGVAPQVLVQIGYGPLGAYPMSDAWQWANATFSSQVGPDDVFSARLALAFQGTYNYTFRYSLDRGLSFTLADLDGVGSTRGNSFDFTRVGTLAVTPAVPEPSVYATLLVGLGVLALRLRRRSR